MLMGLRADGRDPVVVAGLVGVYDADGGLAGEAKYVVGHLLGRLECSLCDISHGPVKRKKSFDALRARLGVPFDVVHRNERSPEVERATGDALPCVVAVTNSEIVTVLDRAALEACRGEVDQLEAARDTAMFERQLLLPSRRGRHGWATTWKAARPPLAQVGEDVA